VSTKRWICRWTSSTGSSREHAPEAAAGSIRDRLLPSHVSDLDGNGNSLGNIDYCYISGCTGARRLSELILISQAIRFVIDILA
jgi:hypothetical protein